MSPIYVLTMVLIGLVVGTMIGTVGIGGVLLAPSLVFLLSMDLSLAMATSMWSFLFTGMMGMISYGTKGSIAWGMSGWLVLGILPASLLGARTNVSLPPKILAGILASVLIYSALNAFRRRGCIDGATEHIASHWLVTIGTVVGFGSALTGTGGALLLIPIFLLLNVPTLKTIGVVQGIQVPIAISASLGFVLFGHVDYIVGTSLGFVQAVGVWIGAQVAHRIPASQLRMCAAVALTLSALMLIREVIFG